MRLITLGRVLSLFLTTAVLSALDISAYAAAFLYPDFSSTSNLTLSGTAAITSNRLRMVPNTPQNLGYVWYSASQPLNSFTTNFAFHYQDIGGAVDTNGNVGTDGIRFFLQKDGFTTPGVEPYLAVEFIAFKSADYGDSQSSNVIIVKNGVQISNVGVEPNFVYRNGNAYDAFISFDGSTLSVGLNGAHVTSVPLSLTDIPVAHVGFVAYDGGGVANQYINSWSFSSVPEPATACLTIVASAGILGRRRRFFV